MGGWCLRSDHTAIANANTIGTPSQGQGDVAYDSYQVFMDVGGTPVPAEAGRVKFVGSRVNVLPRALDAPDGSVQGLPRHKHPFAPSPEYQIFPCLGTIPLLPPAPLLGCEGR